MYVRKELKTYKPKLKYIFCLMRKRSLMPAMSVMRYMNSVGIVPQILIGELEPTKKELDLYKVNYKIINQLPDYDIMFTEAMGFFPFEIYWMTESKKRGKINVSLINNLSGHRNLPVSHFFPDRTKLLDGICVKIEETVLHYKEFTKDLFLINVGDPDWDWWQTDEFKEKVKKVKLELGDKIFVLCENFLLREESILYIEFCIKQAKALGFKIIINIHPDKWNNVPERFHKYYNMNIHHHVLFKAASHAISNISSSTIVENLFLGTKVGCNPLAVHYNGEWDCDKWLNRDSWIIEMSRHFKQEIVDMTPMIFNEDDLNNFLSSFEHTLSKELSIERVFGKINVPCYTEYLFKILDERLGK